MSEEDPTPRKGKCHKCDFPHFLEDFLPQCSCQIVNVRNAFHKVFKSFGWMVFDMSASCNINKQHFKRYLDVC